MPTGNLTALGVEKLTAKGRHSDSGGLYLEVDKQGGKRWLFRYQLNGKRTWLGLGAYGKDTNTLAMARAAAVEARALINRGIDPRQHKVELKAQREAVRRGESSKRLAGEYTFQVCAEEWIAAKQAEWLNPKHRAQVTNTLATYVFPYIGKLPVASVELADVKRCLDPIWETKTETANRVRQRMESVFGYATANGQRVEPNPAQWKGFLETIYASPEKIKKRVRLENGSDGHFPALDYTDLPEFMKSLSEQSGVAPVALRFLILSASRSGPVRFAEWDQVDLGKKTWTIPAESMKAKKEFRVALSSHAVEVLDNLPRVDSYIFPGGKLGRPMSNGAMLAVLRRMGCGDITVHGFRSTFRDYIGEETGFPHRVAEFALAHELTSDTEKAYARGDLLTKRFEMMEDWGSYACRELA